MADQKGSSSNPTKGLVSHLDRNRNLQQDRFVGSSSSSGNTFRSRPQNHNAAPAEANFTNFTAANQLGALPLRPAHQHPPAFQPQLGKSWLDEFQRSSQRQVQDPRIMSPFMRSGAQDGAFPRAANQGPVNQDAIGQSEASRAGADQSAILMSPVLIQGAAAPGFYHPGPINQFGVDAQTLIEFERVRGAYQQHVGNGSGLMGNAPGVTPSADQYNVYPEQVLADNPGLAMEAAFAAYDQDFQNEMDNWMVAHGPEDRVDHVQNMEELLEAEKLHQSTAGLTEFGPSVNPAVPGSNIETYEKNMNDYQSVKKAAEARNEAQREPVHLQDLPGDPQLREHAVQILDKLASQGSAETKKKLESSSFRGLMEAIASGKAVVHGENFVDSANGAVIEDWEALGDNSLQTGNDAGKGKGKGKMKSLEEQAQEKQAKDGGRPADA